MFSALAYVPPDEVRSAFEMVVESAFVSANMDLLGNFMNYFEKTWVGRDRNPPKFKIEWWNLHAAALSGMSRTTNDVEGWHSSFAGRIGVAHPTVYRLIEFLQMEQARCEFLIVNTLAQGRKNRPKRVYRDRNLRLEELVASYSRRPLISFLMSCAHNISY